MDSMIKNERKSEPNNYSWAIIGWTFVLSMGYSIVRYHIVGTVPWKDLPFFIFNKGISFSALILLALNFVFGPLKNLGVNIPNSWLRSRRLVGIMGFIQVLIHVFMSFLLFRPTVYSKYFDSNGTMTQFVGLSMLGGVLAFIFLWIYNVSFSSNLRKDKDLINFITSRKVILTAMLLSGFHLFFIGIEGWMNPQGWPGGLPPISLVAFTFFATGFIINLMGRKDDHTT